MGSSQSANPSGPGQDAEKSLYRKYQDKKGPRPISDEDILKYTGKTRDALKDWADNQPGVGKNQLAGKLAIGNASGLGGAAAGAGYGGWGPSAEPQGANRGMKFPPQRLESKPGVVDE
ncbi:uncharacterized protein MAM_07102 [Metarhizium album ARSEF 1941]|uniref:Uncharacterized protein n=1 Tax=Metarhizium album (strain ARSEF 1941) TaxID=1081103 RepID=A0A0B2WM71_METAS|nr:uncharacterized protein MAM_07102 [Metarhizium album ARSEF 1941]KHN95053.1 hypothetical protein MAM_07102 [Metarhizium album ARSEF 1941]